MHAPSIPSVLTVSRRTSEPGAKSALFAPGVHKNMKRGALEALFAPAFRVSGTRAESPCGKQYVKERWKGLTQK